MPVRVDELPRWARRVVMQHRTGASIGNSQSLIAMVKGASEGPPLHRALGVSPVVEPIFGNGITETVGYLCSHGLGSAVRRVVDGQLTTFGAGN